MVMDSGPIPERSYYWKNIIVPEFYMTTCYAEFRYRKNKYRAIAITIGR